MQLSIVIPTRNRPESLAQCLQAIATSALTSKVQFELFVVDDGSERKLRQHNGRVCSKYMVNYKCLERNRGMAVARNSAALLARGQWIAFIDDDIVVAQDWFEQAGRIIGSEPLTTVGIEGFVRGSGDGVWDREVECLKAGHYLSCHILYRASVFRSIGGFDEHFEFEGPYHEDHELAARISQYGSIIFAPNLKAVHLPRQVKLARYFFESPKRMRQMLNAEIYFFLKHPDRYHLFRYAPSFWRTYRTIVLRHCITTLRRRSIRRLLSHPIQTLTLILAACVEQATAWVLFPRLLLRYIHDRAAVLSPFKKE